MAESYSYNKIEQDFLIECLKIDCRSTSNPNTKESTITYTDSEDIQHEIWYEGPESVDLKMRHAESEGINKFSYWAYSFY